MISTLGEIEYGIQYGSTYYAKFSIVTQVQDLGRDLKYEIEQSRRRVFWLFKSFFHWDLLDSRRSFAGILCKHRSSKRLSYLEAASG